MHRHGRVRLENMGGVAGPSFSGIAPGATVTIAYRRQSGTDWYCSHSSVRQQAGVCAPNMNPAAPYQQRGEDFFVPVIIAGIRFWI
jgi:FtsP/CotA-like multicopper oxidase with cupredoxin domain